MIPKITENEKRITIESKMGLRGGLYKHKT